MKLYFLSIGSNLRPSKNIPIALRKLKAHFHVKKISSVHVTKPVGPPGQKKFWNLALSFESGLKPATIRKRLREIESEMGRKRDPENKYAARIIDLDLLPQPGYKKLSFIMAPLVEIQEP